MDGNNEGGSTRPRNTSYENGSSSAHRLESVREDPPPSYYETVKNASPFEQNTSNFFNDIASKPVITREEEDHSDEIKKKKEEEAITSQPESVLKLSGGVVTTQPLPSTVPIPFILPMDVNHGYNNHCCACDCCCVGHGCCHTNGGSGGGCNGCDDCGGCDCSADCCDVCADCCGACAECCGACAECCGACAAC